MIPQRNLSLLSNRLARSGGRRTVEAILERDYCLAWFLVGLARSGLREKLVFKGGTALKRCYFADYRFSEDLDFTLAEPMALDDILAGLEGIFGEVERVSGIRIQYARADRKSHQNSRAVEDRPVLRGYAEYEDLPEDAHVRAYALNEIGVEKLVALTDRARNEPRDLYDLWFITEGGHVDLGMLVPEIEKKLSFRGRTRETLTEDLEKKEARYKKLWSLRLGPQMATLPAFEDVLRAMRRSLRAANLIER